MPRLTPEQEKKFRRYAVYDELLEEIDVLRVQSESDRQCAERVDDENEDLRDEIEALRIENRTLNSHMSAYPVTIDFLKSEQEKLLKVVDAARRLFWEYPDYDEVTDGIGPILKALAARDDLKKALEELDGEK